MKDLVLIVAEIAGYTMIFVMFVLLVLQGNGI